jgi:hypothetical protein
MHRSQTGDVVSECCRDDAGESEEHAQLRARLAAVLALDVEDDLDEVRIAAHSDHRARPSGLSSARRHAECLQIVAFLEQCERAQFRTEQTDEIGLKVNALVARPMPGFEFHALQECVSS